MSVFGSEIGYTEHILEARSFRVKQLLGIQPSTVADAAPKRGADGVTTTAPAAMTETKPMSGAKKALLESEQLLVLPVLAAVNGHDNVNQRVQRAASPNLPEIMAEGQAVGTGTGMEK
uniref:Uncharacterized protein n=1 Tax=Globodera pallida TaxID=36090 RepID=A0A183BU36_GLOPA